MRHQHVPGSTRRNFLRSSCAALPWILPSHLWTAIAKGAGPNDRINIGMIGMGKRMRSLIASLAQFEDAELVAVSDVVSARANAGVELIEKAYAKNGRVATAKNCPDFRELIAADGIDAVVVSTPDHWHAIQSILAARAGKHVYCEKPLTRTIAEGRAVVRAARATEIVFQTGSQQRTEYQGRFRTAVEYIRNGRIGDLKTIYIGVGGPAVPCNLPDEPLPKGIDWDMWLGPAPKRGFNQVLCPIGVHNHFPRWRDYIEYAGGPLSDIGAHHFDIAQWAMDTDHSGPTSITPPEDTNAISGLRFRYDNGVEMIHGAYQGRKGCHFIGTKGAIFVDRKTLESKPSSILATPLSANDWRLPEIGSNHQRNWIDCIRSGERPVADVEIGHRTNTVCLLANIAYRLNRPLTWDPAAEQFLGDDDANRLLSHRDRSPWNEVYVP